MTMGGALSRQLFDPPLSGVGQYSGNCLTPLEEEAIQRLVAKYQESDLLDTDVYQMRSHYFAGIVF